MPLSFRVQAVDGTLIVVFTDAQILDATVIEQMHREMMTTLDEAQETRVVLDFSRVRFMSSAAMGMLVRVHKKCKQLKKALKLCGLAPQIQQVFRMTNLDRIFDLAPEGITARQAFASKP